MFPSRNMGLNNGAIIQKYRNSRNSARVFNVEPNPVSNEDSLGDVGNKNATLLHSAEANALIGHGTIASCILNADKPKLSGRKADFTPWHIRV